MKKGELSMSMIITAVIAIVILVVVLFLIFGSSKDVDGAINCPAKGGICRDYGSGCTTVVGASCGENSGQECCKPLG